MMNKVFVQRIPFGKRRSVLTWLEAHYGVRDPTRWDFATFDWEGELYIVFDFATSAWRKRFELFLALEGIDPVDASSELWQQLDQRARTIPVRPR